MKDWQTIVVDPHGGAAIKDIRPLHEKSRISEVRAMGQVPEGVGPAIPEAPARGPVHTFHQLKSYPDGERGFAFKHDGFEGRKSLRCADSFDVMAVKAARHGKRPPFTSAQVAMGRFYRDLYEKHANAGVKCSSLESLSQSSGGRGGEFMDAVLRDRQQLDVIRRRIGDRSAMVVRRNRPSKRGSRVTIMDRRLVDIVCLEDGTISDVLKRHGWAIKAELVKSLQVALGQALHRMMGPKAKGLTGAQFGDGCTNLIFD